MKTIYKYEIRIQDNYSYDYSLELPQNYRILDFQCQSGRYFIWVLCFGDLTKTIKVNFKIVGTGSEIDFSTNNYVGTASDTIFVWHLFQVSL